MVVVVCGLKYTIAHKLQAADVDTGGAYFDGHALERNQIIITCSPHSKLLPVALVSNFYSFEPAQSRSLGRV